MAIELRQQLKLTQQLVMTPQLQQAIKLLQLSRLELLDTIRQELEENPVLEEAQEIDEGQSESESPPEEDFAAGEKEVTIGEDSIDTIDWSNYIDEYNTPGKVTYESEGKDSPQYEAFIAPKQTLSGHLLWQLMMATPSSEEERIASLIIGNLNLNGYLDISVEELAQQNDLSTEAVEDVLFLLQSFDPVGICARDLSESLSLQAGHLGFDEKSLVQGIINGYLHHLENRNIKAICKALNTDTESVMAAVEVIRNLDPRPGRQFTDETPQYITPDIYVHKIEEDYVIVLNDDGMPRLRINNYYQKALEQSGKVTENTKIFMQEKLRAASWLIKSIQQRQKTIYRVMESIIKYQRDFFDRGIEYLKPMVLRDVAEDIEMHESTISRVTTNKYAYTPQGIFELKYFFNSSIGRTDGDCAMASASVQQRIRHIIESEDPKKPYSDDKISKLLKEANIDIARRTVAKYREMMRILPSSKRKPY